MNTFIDRQLAQIKVKELLQEAAESRADRKARMAHPSSATRKLTFALAAIPVVLWIVWGFVAG
jgi:hypothetical protein